MKNLKNGFTTMIGALIIICVLLFVYKGKTSFTEASGFLTIGIALLFSNDEKFTENFFPFLFKNKGNIINEVDEDINNTLK